MDKAKEHVCAKCGEKFMISKFFPFCSERCKLLDLEGWLSERYRVSRPAILDEEVFEDEPKNDDIEH